MNELIFGATVNIPARINRYLRYTRLIDTFLLFLQKKNIKYDCKFVYSFIVVTRDRVLSNNRSTASHGKRGLNEN